MDETQAHEQDSLGHELSRELERKLETLTELSRELTCALEDIDGYMPVPPAWLEERAAAIERALDVEGDACGQAIEAAQSAASSFFAALAAALGGNEPPVLAE